jgi:hypothetical protein
VQEWSAAAKAPLRERASTGNEAKRVYELVWDCDMPQTRRGLRGELALDVAVQDFGCLTVPLMAKVYSNADASAAHGARLAGSAAAAACGSTWGG